MNRLKKASISGFPLNIFDNLTSHRTDGKLFPGLATEWSRTEPTTWQFKLRQGVKWHNGDPF